MKHSRFDWILVACFAILASWSGYQLYGPASTKRSAGASYAQLESLSNIVKTKPRGALGWSDVEVGQQFMLRDQLYTHKDSKANLQLTTGENLTLWPNTLVELDQLAGIPSLQVKEGLVYFDLKPGEKVKINLAGKELTLAGDNSRVKLSSFSGKASLESTEGEVSVSDRDGVTQKVDQSNRLEVEKGQEIKSKIIEAQLISPADGAKILTTENSREVLFDWKISQALDQAVVVEIASDPSFAYKKSIRGNKTSLVPGYYFWRLRVENKILQTNLMGFEVVREIESEPKTAQVELVEPADRSSLIISKPGEVIDFKFNTNGLLQIATDEQFKNLVINQRAQNVFSWPVTQLGKFYWRISTEKGESNVQTFEILPGEILPPPQLERAPSEINLEVLDTSSSYWPTFIIQKVYAQEFVAEFSWPEVEGAKAYQVEIFSKENSSKPLLTKQVQSASYKWIGAPLRDVFWRVRAIDAWGRLGSESRMVKTTLLPPSGWEETEVDLISPRHKIKTEVGERVRFEWAKAPGVKSWTWLLSQDLSFSRPERSYKTKNNHLVVENLPKGNWYWKVLAKDKLGRVIESRRRFIEVFRLEKEEVIARELKRNEYELRLNLRSPFDIELGLKVTKPDYEYSRGSKRFVLSGFSASGIDMNLSRKWNKWRGLIDLSYVSGTAFSSLAYKDALLKVEAQKAYDFGFSFPIWLGGGIAYAQTSSYQRAATSNDLSEETLSSISLSAHASAEPWSFKNDSYIQTTLALSAPSRLGLKFSARHILGQWFWGASVEKQSVSDEGELSVTSLALNFGYRWQRKNN
ncbi:MAG: hypothetical protein CME71_04675 [Halobacteriovorax sp.]|nr:hypothetical protein [Halobacteriovorax sp.]